MNPPVPYAKREGTDLTPSVVARLRAGDPAAARLLVDLYRAPLTRFCWGYLGRLEDAEDAFQDVCVKVLRAEAVPDSFRAYVYKIARNHCLNLRRARGRRPEQTDIAGENQLSDSLTGQLTRLADDEARRRVVELVRKLPAAKQEILRLRYTEDLSRAEIGEVLDISESVVKSRLFEAMKTLRTQIADTS